MPIVVNLDVMLARRKMTLTELSVKVDRTIANLSILKSNKAKGIQFDTLDRLCKALACRPEDILEYLTEAEYQKLFDS